MWQIIRELVADRVTIFLTTQYLDEADQLADYVAVLDHGRIVAEGTPAELKRRIPGGHIQLQFAGPDALRAAAGRIPNATPHDDQLIMQVPGDGSIASLRRVLNELDDAASTSSTCRSTLLISTGCCWRFSPRSCAMPSAADSQMSANANRRARRRR